MCNGSIQINWDSSAPSVSKNILGHFIEHLGACIENGIWCYEEPGVSLSGKPHLERVRDDVLEAVKALHPPVLRYPGGCFSDTYHWKDGIGPKNYRPTRRNESWGGIKNILCKMGPLERNHFGTMEFLTLCQDIGAEPYINVNFGTGTPREASDWVEYTNAGASTRYGGLRKKHGHPEPFNVKIWGIGNEIYGFWEKGFTRQVEDYVSNYLQFARAMRAVDPSIKLVAVGKPNDSTWNQAVVSGCAGFVDWLSLHWYFGNSNFLRFMLLKDAIPRNEKGYYMEVNSVRFMEAIIKRAEWDIRNASLKKRAPACKIAIDEWNVWSQWRQACKADKPFYTFIEGIWTALVLNTFIRHAKTVTMANFAQLVNCLGLILAGTGGRIVLSPQYHVIKLYSDHWHAIPARISTRGPMISSARYSRSLPPIDASAIDAAALIEPSQKMMSLFVVNKLFKDGMVIGITLDGFSSTEIIGDVKVATYFQENPFCANTYRNPSRLGIENSILPPDGFNWQLNLPPHSLTSLTIQFV